MRFLFVESIGEFESGSRARGQVRIPAEAKFPPCIIAEAIGQLAGWIAMEHSQFKLRPVAGLVGECVISGSPEAGAVVELAVEMETCDDDAVAYSGSACIDGQPVVTLERCGAPMLALADFDDPDAMITRFALLRSGTAPVEFAATLHEAVDLQNIACNGGAGCSIITPADASFYADHFPRKPVFPATLLLDAEIRLAVLALKNRHGGRMPKVDGIRITDVKLRTFIGPGTAVTLRADPGDSDPSSESFALTASVDSRRIASAGLIFEWR
ncbi:MAG TPA: hypothetical protein VMT64_15745 [Candidatus Binataceae bacterium]|nr:hypothetical protein [Candidatus Binataceae bacterium]